MKHPLLQFFAYEHLPAHLQEISKPFGDLARSLVEILPMNSELTTQLLMKPIRLILTHWRVIRNMPDISLCPGYGCNARNECYRHRAIPSGWQSWMAFKPDEDGKCDSFWPLDEASGALSPIDELEGKAE